MLSREGRQTNRQDFQSETKPHPMKPLIPVIPIPASARTINLTGAEHYDWTLFNKADEDLQIMCPQGKECRSSFTTTAEFDGTNDHLIVHGGLSTLFVHLLVAQQLQGQKGFLPVDRSMTVMLKGTEYLLGYSDEPGDTGWYLVRKEV